MATPRPDLSVIEEFYGKPFKFLRRARAKWEEEARNAPLVTVSVVQANAALYDPTDRHFGPAVVMFTTDPRLCRDATWLAEVTERVRAVRDNLTGDPELDRLGALLRDEDSNFFEDVPLRLTGGVRTRIHVTYIGREELPGPAIPEDGMLLGLGLQDAVRLLKTPQYH